MSGNLKKQLAKLSKRGPHRVLVGDLDFAGLPGKVYTPAEGKGIPAIAFGHDWRKDVSKYHKTLRHIASWGIAVAAPDTETGFMPNHGGLAKDLTTTLQILAGVRLGEGNVTVAPGKLGLAGHGMGAGAAVLAATDDSPAAAVAALYPAVTSPSAETAAYNVHVPGLIIGSGKDSLLEAGNPPRLATHWGGDVVYREVDKGSQAGFTEDGLLTMALGFGRPQPAARELASGLLIGFFLHHLNDDSDFAAFADPAAEAKGFTGYTGEELAELADER